jgi:hypothetical protein
MLLVDDHEGLMPELLTQRKRRGPLAKMAGITPAPGRLQFGMVAGFMSERWPASNRNTRPASVGICSMNKQPSMDYLLGNSGGLDSHDDRLLHWIDDSGIVAICSDNVAVELFDPQIGPKDETGLRLHEHCLFKLGIHLGELWYLKDLAEWLGARGRSAFLLTAPPLRLPGAVGSPACPIATV